MNNFVRREDWQPRTPCNLRIKTMNNLQRFEQNGLELIINTQTGEAFASQSALGRICGVGESTIRYWKTSQKVTTIDGEVPTATGIKTARLFNEDAIYDALAKYNPQLLAQCAKAGIRVYLHKLAGYEVTSTAVQQHQLPQTYLEALKALVATEEEKQRLEAELEEAKPAIAFTETFQTLDGSVSIGDFAKHIGKGRNRLFKLLRDMGIIQKEPSTTPYQLYVERGYFEVNQTLQPKGDGTNMVIPFAVITPKGQVWLHKKLSDRKKLEMAAISLVTQGVVDMTLADSK